MLERIPRHDKHLEPPEEPDCEDPACVDGIVCDFSGPYKCPSIVHMTENERREYMRWMKEGAP